MICFEFENAAVEEIGFCELFLPHWQKLLKKTRETAFPHEICSLKKRNFGRIIALELVNKCLDFQRFFASFMALKNNKGQFS